MRGDAMPLNLTTEEMATVQLRLEQTTADDLNRRWDLFVQTVQKSYDFERNSIKFVMWLLGLVISAISVGLVFFGIRSSQDITRQVETSVRTKLESDPMVKMYEQELQRLKLQLSLDRWEHRATLIQLEGIDQADAGFRRGPTAAEMDVMRAAVSRQDALSARALRAVLLLYQTGFIRAPRQHLGTDGIVEPDDMAEARANLVKAIMDVAHQGTDSTIKATAWTALLYSDDDASTNAVINALRDVYGGKPVASEFRDNSETYLLQLASRIRHRAQFEDVKQLCRSAAGSSEPLRKTAGFLGGMILDRMERGDDAPIVLKPFMTTKDSRAALVELVTSNSRFLIAQDSFVRESGIAPTDLAALFKAWYADRQDAKKAVGYTYYYWFNLAQHNHSFYSQMVDVVLKDAAKTPAYLMFAIRNLIPQRTAFLSRDMTMVPELQAELKDHTPVKCEINFMSLMLIANGHQVKPEDVARWGVQYVPNRVREDHGFGFDTF
jgi:hypothetical protein